MTFFMTHIVFRRDVTSVHVYVTLVKPESNKCYSLHSNLYAKKVREKSRECQSQPAALPRPQDEEETDKTKQAQLKQMYEKH